MRMNRMWIFIVISTIALAGAGLAMAQSIGGVPTDVHLWFTTTASLAAVVAALVALVRKHVWKTLHGISVVGLSMLAGLALAYGGSALGYLSSDWLAFGLSAGLIASGGVDLARGILGAAGTKNVGGDTAIDAARTRGPS